jgi:hypothetical protein
LGAVACNLVQAVSAVLCTDWREPSPSLANEGCKESTEPCRSRVDRVWAAREGSPLRLCGMRAGQVILPHLSPIKAGTCQLSRLPVIPGRFIVAAIRKHTSQLAVGLVLRLTSQALKTCKARVISLSGAGSTSLSTTCQMLPPLRRD